MALLQSKTTAIYHYVLRQDSKDSVLTDENLSSEAIRRKSKRNVVRLKSSNAMLDSADVQIKENERVWCFNVSEKRY